MTGGNKCYEKKIKHKKVVINICWINEEGVWE